MWSDRETSHDCLGFRSYVPVLADICVEKNLAPLALGVFGSWGSGKTSLMRMLKRHIDETADKAGVKTLWFNAWRYEGREEAQSALIHSILAKLAEDKGLLDDTREVLARLKKGASVLKLAKLIGKMTVTLTPDFDGLLDCFRDESERVADTMERFETDFEDLLKLMKIERVVVFIDDLDRCHREKVVETFETIKLFLNIPECTFVVGADADKIEQAVAETYRIGEQNRAAFARDYLEKIIQIPFRIPQQQRLDIACYVGMLVLGRHLGDEGWKQLVADRPKLLEQADGADHRFTDWALEHRAVFEGPPEEAVAEIEGIIPHVSILAHGLRGNPRQIKRFLNILGLRRRLAKSSSLGTKPDALVKLAVLEYVWPDFFASVVEEVDPGTGRSDLIGAVLEGDAPGKEGDSKLVTDALAQPGLAAFLAAEPKLPASLDLRPYLFLAQTALERGAATALAPLEEVARSLAAGLTSPDRIRARAAARKAASQEPAVVASVVRLSLGDLGAAKDDLVRVRLLDGLSQICGAHRDQYPAIVKSLGALDPGKNDALAILAGNLLKEAAKAGVDVPKELEERFAKVSKIAAALTGKGPGLRPPGR